MRKLLPLLALWIARHLLSLLLIVLVLLAGNWLLGQYRASQALKEEIAALRSGQKDLQGYARGFEQAAGARLEALRQASLAQLDERIAALEAELAGKKAAQGGMLAGALGGQGIETWVRREMEIKAQEQELAGLRLLRANAVVLASREAARKELERRQRVQAFAEKELTESEQAIARFKSAQPGPYWLPGTDAHRRYEPLDEAHRGYTRARDDARAAVQQQQRAIEGIAAVQALPGLLVPPAAVEEVRAKMQAAIAPREEHLRRNWVERASRLVINVLPTALAILALLILAPLAIKALFYYGLARAAERRPPIHILPAGSTSAAVSGGPSAVSQAITIDGAHHLLALPDTLQSTSLHGVKGTQWLLDWRAPLTSIASGMVALTRIRAPGGAETVVLSALKNPLHEIAVLALPAGSALVLQPRALIGALVPDAHPLRITKHWRLFSARAWLTLQLRYLVFHGPVQLVVRGCRGVRIEPAGRGRRISQAATIAFDAGLGYATARCETFTAYLTGEQELFNDSFIDEAANVGVVAGDGDAPGRAPGCFIYEEVPNDGRKPGLTGRGLEGFTDAALKVFGI